MALDGLFSAFVAVSIWSGYTILSFQIFYVWQFLLHDIEMGFIETLEFFKSNDFTEDFVDGLSILVRGVVKCIVRCEVEWDGGWFL